MGAGTACRQGLCAGLLHDIGKLVLDRTGLGIRWCWKRPNGTRPCPRRRKMLGTTHADVGREVIAHWKPPRPGEEISGPITPCSDPDEEQYQLGHSPHRQHPGSHDLSRGIRAGFPEADDSLELVRPERRCLDHDGEGIRQIDAICKEIGIGKPVEGLFGIVNTAYEAR